MKNFNHIKEIGKESAVVEPGTYYRDFEPETLKHNLILPCYTSSKLLCTVGGMVANNSAGEKSLEYGKTDKYVEELQMVLRDGNQYTFKKLTKSQLDLKMEQQDFEGTLYENMFNLLDSNYEKIKAAKPKVSKNSSGYNLWNVWNKEEKTFDLSQIFIGAQGTLGINTNIKFKLVPTKKEHGMLIVYMKDFNHIPQIVKNILRYHPTSFESFDAYTLDLALQYVLDFAPILHTSKLHIIMEFLPEFLLRAENKVPKLTLLVEFEGNSKQKIEQTLLELQSDLAHYDNIHMKEIKKEDERLKDWAIRRESFNLLKNKLTDKKACPFIDDTCVDPNVLPEFLPRLYKILDGNHLLYSIAGHIGNGNFHIFPLLDMTDPKEREKIFTVGKEVFDLVLEYKGSLSGEHNDGLVRAPYLKQQFGEEMYKIFKQVKQIFDPHGIFNPKKKIDVTVEGTKPLVTTKNNW